jgi:hypothetical protein
MPEHPIPHVPPNSTALREVAHAVDAALTLPKPAAERDELTYLRIMRDRARVVRQAMKDILSDREIEADGRDVMAVVGELRAWTEQLSDDQYSHSPEPTI